MTLRKIHNNIMIFKNDNSTKNNFNHQEISYDEQPPHPKTLVNKKINNQIQNDLHMIKEKNRGNVKKYEIEKINVLKNIHIKNKQSKQKQQNEDQNSEATLFIPERKRSIKKSLNSTWDIINNNLSNTSTAKSIKRKNSLINNNSQFNTERFTKSNHQQKEVENHYHHTINYNTSQITRLQYKQKQRQVFLKNRLNFISIDNQRQQQKLQIVKRKYEKVLSVRNSTLRQKEIFQKRKLESFVADSNQKKAKIHMIQMQKSQKNLSISRLKQLKSISAASVRNQIRSNKNEIMDKQLTQLNLKKQLVRKTRTSLQTSRQRINQINRSRISSVRSIENKRLIRNYVNVEKRQKETQRLYDMLQREIKIINEKKLKAASQLKQYEAILKPEFGNHSIHSSRVSQKGSKSFYLTHY